VTYYAVRLSGAFSQRVALRTLVVGSLLAGTVVASMVASLSVGETRIPPLDVVRAVFGAGDETTHLIVFEFRLPRVVAAVVVGASLAMSGAIFQSLARNPLAAPDIIGVSAGAVFAAVFVIITGVGYWLVPYAAFGGALAAAILVYVLAYRRGIAGYRLVLVGIGVTAVLSSGTAYLLTRGDLTDVLVATVWMVGSLYGSDWQKVTVLLANFAVLAPLAIGLTRQLEALQLGDDLARGLGTRVERARTLLIVVGVALVAAGVAVAGAIGFVAFVAPHIARRLLGAPSGSVLPLAALVGAALVTLADIVSRTVVSPAEIPVGVFTALIGAPYFLYLLYQSNRLGKGA
jgi:iron complex transport system permease protein